MSEPSPVALVTGGSRGIGRAVCRSLARGGHTVIALARSAADLKETTDLIAAEGGSAVPLPCDVQDTQAVQASVQSVLERFGRIDVLVNNAGGGTTSLPDHSEAVTVEDFEASLDINLVSTFAFCRAVIEPMKAAGRGSIINISSVAARQGSHLSDVAYTAAKTGVLGLSRHLARELGPFGIRVNTVAPGVIGSKRVADKVDHLTDEDRTTFLSRIPLGRIGQVEEVAQVVSFLASPAASYIHGAVIDVNGGLFMG